MFLGVSIRGIGGPMQFPITRGSEAKPNGVENKFKTTQTSPNLD
jgi:hypothetical protein